MPLSNLDRLRLIIDKLRRYREHYAACGTASTKITRKIQSLVARSINGEHVTIPRIRSIEWWGLDVEHLESESAARTLNGLTRGVINRFCACPLSKKEDIIREFARLGEVRSEPQLDIEWMELVARIRENMVYENIREDF